MTDEKDSWMDFVKQRMADTGEQQSLTYLDEEPTPACVDLIVEDSSPNHKQDGKKYKGTGTKSTVCTGEDITSVMVNPAARGEVLSKLRVELNAEMILIEHYAADFGCEDMVVTGIKELHFAYVMYDLKLLPHSPKTILSDALKGKDISDKLDELQINGCEVGSTIQLMAANEEYRKNIETTYFHGLAQNKLLKRFS